MSDQTRGMRNNNPGNLRYAKSVTWVGLVQERERKDTAFFEFKSVYWGLRAMIMQIRNYYRKKRDLTIKDIISRYAPSFENNTKSYYEEVAKFCNLNTSYTITPFTCLTDTRFEEVLPFMILRMCQIESKYTPNIMLLEFICTLTK